MRWKPGKPHGSEERSGPIGEHIDIYPTDATGKRTRDSKHHEDIKVSYDTNKPIVGDIKGARLAGKVISAKTQLPVSGATVTVRNEATDFKQSAVTNHSGEYDIGQLPSGSYSVVIEATGYETKHDSHRIGNPPITKHQDARKVEKSEDSTPIRYTSPQGLSSVVVKHKADHRSDHRTKHKADHRTNNKK